MIALDAMQVSVTLKTHCGKKMVPDRDHAIPLPGNRQFGLFFAAVCVVGGGYARWKLASGWQIPLFGAAVAFAGLAIFVPALLEPLNRLWYQLGLVLGRIVSPIVLGVIFFVVITPVAMLMRLAGRDALRLKKSNVSSYWINREPPGPEPESYRLPF
ncbi:MAG: hypothetical protein HQL95_05885 [Magnetococcales bacterium]|nr:hypothetical protein [Magnetococcales bacterium]